VFKTVVECPGIDAIQQRRVIGQTVTLRKSMAVPGADVILGDAIIGQLDAAVGAQVASGIDRGLAFKAVIQRAYNYEPFANATTWADLKVEYLLEKGQPSIEMPEAPYLFVDTETTGLPTVRHAAPWDFANWPRLVEIAWLLVDGERRETAAASYIIKPRGFIVPWDAVQKHGITTDMALRQGVEIRTALDAFVKDLRRAAVLVAHNIEYDQGILGAELLRAGYPNYLYNKKRICTMQSATAYCGIPGRYGDYKYPKLSELHCKLFSHPYREVHRALPDVRAVEQCYFALRDRGIIT
jgi:DNA polymerase III epsilon subunit-like protein